MSAEENKNISSLPQKSHSQKKWEDLLDETSEELDTVAFDILEEEENALDDDARDDEW